MLLQRLLLILLFFVASHSSELAAQTTLFSENFETSSGAQNKLGSTAFIGWKDIDMISGGNNFWWIFDGTRCSIIGGSYSMGVSKNTPATSGTMPQYNASTYSNHIAYYATKINATGYTTLRLNFSYICNGEPDDGFNSGQPYDYGMVSYSYDGTSWTDLTTGGPLGNGKYFNQSTAATVTNLNISALDGQQFYIGFRWISDAATKNDPPFVIDGISITGIAPCSASITGTTPGSRCGTGTVTLGATASSGSTINWYSSSSGGSSLGTGTSFTTPSISSTTTYYVDATNGTCTSSPRNAVVATVNANSTNPSSASASPASVCPGGSSNLSVSGGSLGTGASWKWYTGSCGGTLVGTGASISVTPGSTTTYYVRAEGTCNNTSCVSVSLSVGATTTTWTGSASTDWSTAGNWTNGVPNSSCFVAVVPNTTNKPVVSSAVTIGDLTIQNGGIVRTDAALTITGTFTIDNGGTYIHNNTSNPKTTIFNGVENFATNSTFEVRNWAGISYFLHNGSTTASDAMHSTPYGNLTINWNAGGFQWEWQDYMTKSSNPRILGTLDVQYTGSNDIHICGNGNSTHQVGGLKVGSGGGRVVFMGSTDAFVTTSGPTTFNVLGDVTISGGNFWLDEDGCLATAPITMNISGNFLMTGGSIDIDYGADYDSDVVHKINLSGNFSQTGGVIEATNYGSCGGHTCLPYHEWHFSKNGTQTYANSSTATGGITGSNGLGSRVIHVVDASSTLQLNSNLIIGTAASSCYTLQLNGVINAGSYRLYPNNTGSGTYYYSGLSMASGARLRTSNTNGFFTDGSASTTYFDNGNNAPSFSLNANSTIEYNGSAQQVLTNGGATSLNYAILDVNNSTSGGAALTMSAGNVNCDQLRLNQGVVSTGSNSLTVLNTTAGSSGSIQNHSATSYINTGTTGKLRRYIAATGSYDFPTGNTNSSSFQLMNLNITSGNTASYIDVNFNNPSDATGVGLPLTEGADSYTAVLNNGGVNATTGNTYGGVWTVTPNSGTANYNMTLYGRNFDNHGSKHTIIKRTTAGLPSSFFSDDMTSSTWSISGTSTTNSWITSSSGSPISGKSLQVYQVSGPVYSDYNENVSTNNVAYRAVSSSGYTGLSMSFDWKCVGEEDIWGIWDYGMVVYSTNTVTPSWQDITTGGTDGSGHYYSQSAVTNATISLPSSLNNTGFLIGFRWINDNNTQNGIPFIIDNISITGTPSATPSWGIYGTYSSSTGSSPITAARTGFSGFSQFAIAKSGVPLPVELLNFSAECSNDDINLSWKTATESNNSFFTVERSKDAQSYEPIAMLNGAGNSSQVILYNYLDTDPIHGISYYRLSQTDFNGTREIFTPISVDCSGNGDFSFTINGNPESGDIIHVLLNGVNGGDVDIYITDLMGRMVSAHSIPGDTQSMLVNIIPGITLSSGMYIMTAYNNGIQVSNKFVVDE